MFYIKLYKYIYNFTNLIQIFNLIFDLSDLLKLILRKNEGN